MTHHAHGQTTIELAVLTGVAVAALVGMAVYVQRAYQGYVYANASSHGQQFDPTKPRSLKQRLKQFSQTQEIDITMEQASALNGVPGRILGTKTTVESKWDITQQEQYEAR